MKFVLPFFVIFFIQTTPSEAACQRCNGSGRITSRCRSCGGSGVSRYSTVGGARIAWGCTACDGWTQNGGKATHWAKKGSGRRSYNCTTCRGTGLSGSELAKRRAAEKRRTEEEKLRREAEQRRKEKEAQEKLRKKALEEKARLETKNKEEWERSADLRQNTKTINDILESLNNPDFDGSKHKPSGLGFMTGDGPGARSSDRSKTLFFKGSVDSAPPDATNTKSWMLDVKTFFPNIKGGAPAWKNDWYVPRPAKKSTGLQFMTEKQTERIQDPALQLPEPTDVMFLFFRPRESAWPGPRNPEMPLLNPLRVEALNKKNDQTLRRLAWDMLHREKIEDAELAYLLEAIRQMPDGAEPSHAKQLEEAMVDYLIKANENVPADTKQEEFRKDCRRILEQNVAAIRVERAQALKTMTIEAKKLENPDDLNIARERMLLNLGGKIKITLRSGYQKISAAFKFRNKSTTK